jgi:hypothetical protein
MGHNMQLKNVAIVTFGSDFYFSCGTGAKKNEQLNE